MNKISGYIKSAYEEIKKVTWPSKKETTRLTTYVVGVSLAVGLFVMVFDYVFKELLTILIVR